MMIPDIENPIIENLIYEDIVSPSIDKQSENNLTDSCKYILKILFYIIRLLLD
jgi:hypothetical protein